MRREPMVLTQDFKKTVKARAERDVTFREALLTEAVEQLIAGEVDVGKAVLRDYINATVGFERLAKATGTPSKSLMRMLGPKGNPRASNLLTMIGKLQRISTMSAPDQTCGGSRDCARPPVPAVRSRACRPAGSGTGCC